MSFFKKLFGTKEEKENERNESFKKWKEDFDQDMKKFEDRKAHWKADIKEEISNELIRIILESKQDFLCFEFQVDSVKMVYFRKFRLIGESIQPCYMEHSDLIREVYKTERVADFKVKESEIFRLDVKVLDFYLTSDIFQNLKCFNLGYQEAVLGNRDLDPKIWLLIQDDQRVKAEKIVYLFNNLTAYNDMFSLNESYLKSISKIEKERELFIKEVDADGNGVIDVLENSDFPELLKIKQKILIEFEKSEGKSYVQNFIKLSRFLADKKKNIQTLFERIKEDGANIPHGDYLDFVGILRNQIHTYNLMLISSLNMIISLTDDDRITFYEIYEAFDQLNVFSSNHEKEVSVKLNNIENKLDDVIQSIHEMEISICDELMNLQFISEDISGSINGLSEGLSEINSSIQFNNLLTGIQMYQMYKINKNIKGLN